MDNVLPIRSMKDEAADWLARLEAEDVTEQDRRAFAQWQASDGRHREAFRDVTAASKRIDALFSREMQSEGTTRSKSLTLAAAAAVVLTVIGMLWFRVASPPLTYASTIGEIRQIMLPDGSKLQLNTDSEVEVDYGADRRRIRLRQGEALFTVARDPMRPFIVQARQGAIKALGTAFLVRLDRDEAVQVLVTEGRVEVTSGRRQSLQLKGGESVRYREALGAAQAMKPQEIGRSLAWREGMLLFEGEPLERVLEEVGRYTHTKLLIADPEIRELSVYGYFKATDLETFLRRLEANFPVAVGREPDVVRLARRGRQGRSAAPP